MREWLRRFWPPRKEPLEAVTYAYELLENGDEVVRLVSDEKEPFTFEIGIGRATDMIWYQEGKKPRVVTYRVRNPRAYAQLNTVFEQMKQAVLNGERR